MKKNKMIPKYKTILETKPEFFGKELSALQKSSWTEAKRRIIDYFDRNGTKVHESSSSTNIGSITSYYSLDFANYTAGAVVHIDEVLPERKFVYVEVILASQHRSLDGLAEDILNRANGFLYERETVKSKKINSCFGIDL